MSGRWANSSASPSWVIRDCLIKAEDRRSSTVGIVRFSSLRVIIARLRVVFVSSPVLLQK